MLSIQLEGDTDDVGRVIQTPAQTVFTVGGKLVSVNGTPMSIVNKCGGATANGASNFTIGGVPVNFYGNIDTCGTPLVGSSNFTG
jgi:uncharacterized Zn-binding protein involved in type VI secretion